MRSHRSGDAKRLCVSTAAILDRLTSALDSATWRSGRTSPSSPRRSRELARREDQSSRARRTRRTLQIGDRSSAQIGGGCRSSPPWDRHRAPVRTTASITALARRLQAPDARLWRIRGAPPSGTRDPLWCHHGPSRWSADENSSAPHERISGRASRPSSRVSSKAPWRASRNRDSATPRGLLLA